MLSLYANIWSSTLKILSLYANIRSSTLRILSFYAQIWSTTLKIIILWAHWVLNVENPIILFEYMVLNVENIVILCVDLVHNAENNHSMGTFGPQRWESHHSMRTYGPVTFYTCNHKVSNCTLSVLYLCNNVSFTSPPCGRCSLPAQYGGWGSLSGCSVLEVQLMNHKSNYSWCSNPCSHRNLHCFLNISLRCYNEDTERSPMDLPSPYHLRVVTPPFQRTSLYHSPAVFIWQECSLQQHSLATNVNNMGQRVPQGNATINRKERGGALLQPQSTEILPRASKVKVKLSP
jgi:hypothetical protein